MNNKDKKRKKYTRKVILLKYKDTRERLILTRTVNNCSESLKIKIQCDTQPVKQVSKTVTQNEKYPIFRAQLKDRIVPRCFRNKCRRDVQHKTKQCKQYRQRKSKHKSKNLDKNNSKGTASIITISDDEYDGLQYEDISSCTDDEIDTLLESTRKRMKDSDEEWKLLPRRCSKSDNLVKRNSYNRSTRSPSLNSLDTLVLGDMEKKRLTTPKLNKLYSPITSPEDILQLEPLETSHSGVKRRLQYEPIQSLKRKEHHDDEQSNTKKKIKLEPPETNNSRAKCGRNYDSKLSGQKNGNLQKNGEDQITYKQAYAAYVKAEVMSPQNIIKPEPLETNNNTITYQANDVPIGDKKTYEIDKVITKLERNDMDYSELKPKLIDIKQELYSNIS